MSRLPAPAIVVGLDCITGLQTARILVDRQIPVFAIAKDRHHFCCRTRVCERIIYADTESDDFIGALTALGPQLDERGVLFPCTDLSVLHISRRREELRAWYHVVLPEENVVEMLMHKSSFCVYAQEHELPIPPTLVLRSREDAEQAAAALSFPCIVKPTIKTPRWDAGSDAKAYKVWDSRELLALYDRLTNLSEFLIAQEWIAGKETDHFTCNCYFDRDSRPLVTFVTRKLRQWPPQTGTGSLGVECRNDAVLKETVSLFEGVRFRGLGYLEMKKDSGSGQHLIIEPNVGRPTGRSASAEASGVDLLYAKYCDTLGLPLPENLEQLYRGTKWIYFGRDVRSALHQWRHGNLTTREWWRSWRGRKVDAVFSWRDPLPFLYDVWRGLTILAGGRRGT